VIQLIRNPKLDFMGASRLWITVSLLACAASLVVLPVRGLKLGIEFTGGAELQIRYAQAPDLGAIRAALQRGGLGNHVVTTIGEPADHEVYVRLGDVGERGDVTSETLELLRAAVGGAGGGLDLNVADRGTLEALLRQAPGLSEAQAAAAADAIAARRTEAAIFPSLDAAAAAAGLTPEAQRWLAGQATVGPLALRSQSFIGPAVGAELVTNTVKAVLLSLGLMLVYIGFRFQLQWGVAGVLALIHDTLITLGLFSLFDQEMSLPVVAAFLTLIGYSINDTVVVFDRIRENRAQRPGDPMGDVVNRSINQTLARTVITSGLTWLSCLGLFLFGGPALRPFSFVLTVGIVVGTYSSIFVASPVLVLWSRYRERRRPAAAVKSRA